MRLTDGNLSRQLTLLNDAGLIEVWKGQHNRRPQTLVRLTPQGRKRFAEYLSVLESVLSDAAQRSGSKTSDDEEPEPRRARTIDGITTRAQGATIFF